MGGFPPRFLIRLPMIYLALLHDNYRIAAVENGVDLPLVLRLFLELDGGGGDRVAEGGGPKGFEVVEVCGPAAVPLADGRAELYGVDFVVAARRVVVAGRFARELFSGAPGRCGLPSHPFVEGGVDLSEARCRCAIRCRLGLLWIIQPGVPFRSCSTRPLPARCRPSRPTRPLESFPFQR
jgi:hypothetical protein